MNCPHCQQVLPADFSPAASCPFCGHDLQNRVGASGAFVSSPAERRTRWRTFWIAFLGAPMLGLLLGPSGNAAAIALLLQLFGAIFAGIALAKLFAKTRDGVIAGCIILSIGILVIDTALYFTGCIALHGLPW